MLRKLVNLDQLYMFVTELTLVHNYDKRPYIWDTRLSVSELINTLIQRTTDGQVINYGDFDEDGRVKYFVSIRNQKPLGIIWLLHVKFSKRDITKPILKEIFKDLKDNGFNLVQFVTSNTRPSFKRWATSLKAEPIAVNYQIII